MTPILVLDDLEDVQSPAPNDGDVLTYDDVAGLWKPTAAPPAGYDEGARVYHSLDIDTLHNTWTYISYNSERYDTDLIHDNVTNNSRLTCKTAGIYIIVAQISWDLHATGTRQTQIRLNRAVALAQYRMEAFATEYPNYTMATIYKLAVNDYIEVLVRQTSGVTLKVLTGAQYSPEFMMQRIG
ncbi:hypothetical protein ES703_119372 [subsurface metagenome]